MRGLALLIVRRAGWVVAVAVPLLAAAAAIGASAESHLSTGGFTDPSWESARALATLQETFPGAAEPNILLLATATAGSVDDAPARAAGLSLTAALARTPGVADVRSYWSSGLADLRGAGGREALVVGVAAGDEATMRATAENVAASFDTSSPPLTVSAGGTAVVQAEIADQSSSDLRRAEAITVPITAVLLLVLFGSGVGASLPLVVGGVAIVGTLFLLRVLTGVTDVSVFALNVITGMGLGLGIDYSLLIVTRYREEMRAGRTREGALVRTMETAGRTVVFSAVTVAIALASLALFPVAFLRSFAYAGCGVVALAALAATTVLPAVMHLLGPRIEWGRVPGHRPPERAERFWYARARAVMGRPVVVSVAVVALLLAAGAPFLRIGIGDDDERILPASESARAVGDALRRSFAVNPEWTLAVVAPQTGGARPATIDAYAAALSGLPRVARVDAVTGHYAEGRRVAPADANSASFATGSAAWLSVASSVEPFSPSGEELVRALRAKAAPFGVLVGGSAAQLVDSRDALLARLPIALAFIAVATFILLFLMVGSLLVPLKTLVLNVLSLSAMFGALVFVFQDGHLSGLLGFTPTGTISIRTPVLLFCFAFGLSMDYEVFLVSRIKEEYDNTGDNDEAVARGLQHTGRLVTSAALLMAAVFLAFLGSGVETIKVIGLGLALAVLVDAFLIRATLVPALMHLLGDRNWWAPRSLRRLYLLVGIWEREPLAILDVGTPTHLTRASAIARRSVPRD